MAPVAQKRGRGEDGERRPKKKKPRVKRQAEYHSSSEDEDAPRFLSGANSTPAGLVPRPSSILKQTVPIIDSLAVDEEQPAVDENGLDEDDLDEDEALAKNTAMNAAPFDDEDIGIAEEDEIDNGEEDGDETNESSDEGIPLTANASDSDEDELEEDDDYGASDSDEISTTSSAQRAKEKRNDPTAFATSISKILDTKLTTTKRSDPVLSRSKSAAEANKTLADDKLASKARAQIRAERKQALERGRVKDVLGLETQGVDTGKVLEEEKKLKKTAQRGVVKLFNAVRAAQVKAEEAARQVRSDGVVGMQKREERVNEMSKQGFLDLISSGGKKSAVA